MSNRERESLLSAFDSNWIAPVGPALEEFEARVSSIARSEDAVAVSSGTAALHLALLVMDIGPGDVVLCPSVTFVAAANVISYVGATPHLVDCDPISGNVDPESLVYALATLASRGHKPAALIAVDLYGMCADYTTIAAVCNRYGVPIIEDAAEAIGATHAGQPAGSFGTLGVFSFNGNKLVTTGGGGALVGPTELLSRARHLAGQARLPVRHFEHDAIGYAYRLSNISASIGNAQLTRLDSMMNRTREIYGRYLDELGPIAGVSFSSQAENGLGNCWLTVAHLDQSLHPTPSAVCDALAEHNIEARPTWKPMHLQKVYAETGRTGGRGSEAHYATGLCLPSGSSMTEAGQSRVIAAFTSALEAAPVIDIADRIELTDELSLQHQDSRATTS